MPEPTNTEQQVMDLTLELSRTALALAEAQAVQPPIDIMDLLRAGVVSCEATHGLVSDLTVKYGEQWAEAQRLRVGIEDLRGALSADPSLEVADIDTHLSDLLDPPPSAPVAPLEDPAPPA